MADLSKIIINVDIIRTFNDENGFIIFTGRDFESNKEFVVKGYSFDVNIDDLVECKGKWITHPKYGNQFDAKEIYMYTPKDSENVLKYLKSGYIKGIKNKIAENIFAAFGENSINILDENPHELKKIKGIGQKTLNKIIEDWNEKRILHKQNEQLKELGFTFEEALSLSKIYRENVIETICKQPYSIVLNNEIRISFDKIDKIALGKLKFNKEDPTRILTYLLFALSKNERLGNTCILKSILFNDAKKHLKIDDETLEVVFLAGEKFKKIIELKKGNESFIQSYRTYQVEFEIVDKIKSIINRKSNIILSPDKKISLFETKDFKLSKEQKLAITESLTNKVNIVNGGPGVGKTTALNILIKILKQERFSFKLCAQTGRAAQRMSESTGEDAATIHRTLEYNPITKDFQRNEFNTLEEDFIILDEASMVDTYLFNKLLKAINDKSSFIIIGDVNQIASIEAGSVLRDLIDSEKIPTSKIKEIQRQAADSGIVKNAYLVNEGNFIDFKNNKNDDFFFIKTSSDEKTLENIEKMIQNNIPNAFLMNPKDEVQILTSNHQGKVGRIEINKKMQSILNGGDDKAFIKRGDVIFKENDNVIQIKNNYEKNIFNGDSGIIESIYSNKVMIDFLDKEVEHSRGELDEIELSYAITMHKSQGSEYPLIIIPISQKRSIIFDRSLLYTAITRGKFKVIIIGSERSLKEIIANDYSRNRITHLKEKINEKFN